MFTFRTYFIAVVISAISLPEMLFGQQYVEQAIQNWNTYMRGDLNLLKEDAFETIRRGVEEEDDYAIAVGKRSLGTYLARSGSTEKSLIYLEDATTYFLKEGDLQLAAETLNELGNAYQLAGRLTDASKAYLNSIQAGRRSSDPTAVFLAEINLAQAYLELNDTTRAYALVQDYKRKSASFNKWEAVANAYAVLGKIAQGQGKNDLSVEFFQKSAFFGLKSKAFSIRGQALNNLAIVKFADGNNTDAEDLFKEALKLRKQAGAVNAIAESQFNLALFYEQTDRIQKAIFWYQEAIAFAIKHNLSKELQESATALSDLYANQGNWKEANDVLKKLSSNLVDVLNENQKDSNLELRQLDGFDAFLNNDQSLKNNGGQGSLIYWFIAGFVALCLLVLGIAYRRK